MQPHNKSKMQSETSQKAFNQNFDKLCRTSLHRVEIEKKYQSKNYTIDLADFPGYFHNENDRRFPGTQFGKLGSCTSSAGSRGHVIDNRYVVARDVPDILV